MRITLVSPRISLQKGDFLGSGVPYWPVEMATLAAFLREAGTDVSVIDLFGSDPRHLEERPDHYLQGRPLRSFFGLPAVEGADVFIVFAMSYMSHRELLDILAQLRERRPDARLVVLENSQAVTAYALPRVAGEFFDAGADALLCGTPYANWPEIDAWLKRPATPPENLLTRQSTSQPVRRTFVKEPSYPVPAWDLFPREGYWSIPYSHGPKTKRYLPILTSRGCPYRCDFCVVPETNTQRWAGRAPAEVVAEILQLKERFGVRHFQVEDLNPTVSSPRWGEICRLLVEKRADVLFHIVSGTKAETVRLEQVPLLAKAGCRYLSLSPESGSPRVLRAIGKPFDHRHGVALVRACHENGIYTQACFLVGHPAEEEDDFRQTCEYLRLLVRNGLDEAAFFVVAPFPGSTLERRDGIALSTREGLLSFSPRQRADWKVLTARRRKLITIFFAEKLRRGLPLWLMGIRALFGVPRTKMENLPRRVAFIALLLLLRSKRRQKAPGVSPRVAGEEGYADRGEQGRERSGGRQ